MRKFKYIALILSFCFIAILYTNVPICSAAANDLKLFGYENLYGHEDVGCTINHYDDGAEEDSFIMNYTINLWYNSEVNNKIYFLLDGSNNNFDDDVFYMQFTLTDKNNNIIPYSDSNARKTFDVVYDSDYGVSLKTKHTVSLEMLEEDYIVNNSYEYIFYDTTTSDADEGHYRYNTEFSGKLYALDFSDFEYRDFKLQSIEIKFHTDGNHPRDDKYFGGNFANLWNYDEASFQLLINDIPSYDPLKVSSIESVDDSIVVNFVNVPTYVDFKKIRIKDKNGINEYNLSLTRSNLNVALKVNNINLSSLGNNSYTILGYYYSTNGNEFFIPEDKTLNYSTYDIYYQCFAYTYARYNYSVGFLGSKKFSDSSIFIKMYDTVAKTRITNAVSLAIQYVYDYWTTTKHDYKNYDVKDVKDYPDSFFVNTDFEGVYKLPDDKRKVDVFLDNSPYMALFKELANAHSYMDFDYEFKTTNKIHREADNTLNYKLTRVRYFNTAGELVNGSFYENAMYVDSNGVVRNGNGEEQVGFTFDGYNIIDNKGNVVEPSMHEHSKFESEMADDVLREIILETAEDINDEANVWDWLKSKFKEASNVSRKIIAVLLILLGIIIVVLIWKFIRWVLKK